MKANCFIRANVLVCIFAIFFLVARVSAQNEAYTGAINPEAGKIMAEKPNIDYTHLYLPPNGREGGEDIASAIPIPSLPYNDSGNTCDNLNDYDEACPYTDGSAPEVVYSYVAPENQIINIDLCSSLYDTKVYIYENNYTPGYPYACNDDYYYAPPCWTYSSAIFNLSLTSGNTYYIVVDGYGSACGDYYIDISLYTPPWCINCFPCSIPEGEPDIQDNGHDVTNGGCNMLTDDPPMTPIFTPIQLNQVICARANVYNYYGNDYRDTDWYIITLNEAGRLYWSGIASFHLQLYMIPAGCPAGNSYTSGAGTNCSVVSIYYDLPAGTYYLWAGPYDWSPLSGTNYNVVATLNAPPPDDWCAIAPPVPVSGWALFIGIGLIIIFAIVRIRKMV